MDTRRNHPLFDRRLKLAAGIVVVLLGLIGSRLWFLQVAQGTYFRDQSENNRIRTIRTAAPRGRVFDREGRLLVQNRSAFDIGLMLEDVPNVDDTLKLLAEITSRDFHELKRQLQHRTRRMHFEPRVVIPDASQFELARVKVNSYRLPGVIVEAKPTRRYPYGSIGAQVLGYVREISRPQLERMNARDDTWRYRAGDLVGQAGLELEYEATLRGKPGYVQVEVDARGNRRAELGIVDVVRGKDIALTLDLDLQLAAIEALEENDGAVVALDVSSGDVLVSVSAPSFDPNLFSGEVLPADWQAISTDRRRPLRNRVLTEVYAPGSTFKLVVALAGLAEKKISPTTEFYCPGYVFLGRRFNCHKRGGHGKMNLFQAITQSCNVYFYQLGQLLGVNPIGDYSRRLGLGEQTGIDLPGESAGLVPSTDWKLSFHGARWYPGDTLPVAIGQGYLTVTPLQMAVAVSAIANGGVVYKPRLIREIFDLNGISTPIKPKVLKTNPDIPEKVFTLIQESAALAVNDARGTGGRARLKGITVAGKTGTAQVSALHTKSKDHAWFVAFAPLEKPEIAVVALVEHGGKGGVAAAPIVRKVMEAYFSKKGMFLREDQYGPLFEAPYSSRERDKTLR